MYFIFYKYDYRKIVQFLHN